MKTGIIIIATGSRAYYGQAVNLAASLKAEFKKEGKLACDLPILLIHDGTQNGLVYENRALFWKDINFAGLGIGSKAPFYLKTCIYDLSPFDRTLLLDADSLCIGDLTGYLSRFQEEQFASIVHAIGDGHNPEKVKMIWARVGDLYDFYKISKDRKFYELNTSAILFQKCKIAEDIFTLAKHFYAREWYPKFGPYGPQKLANQGLGFYPDELAFEVALMHTGHKMSPGFQPIGFRYGRNTGPFAWTQENKRFPLVSLPGGIGNAPRHLWETYDRIRMSFSRNAAKRVTGSYTGTAAGGSGFRISEKDKAANNPPKYPYEGLGPRRRLKSITKIIKRYEKSTDSR